MLNTVSDPVLASDASSQNALPKAGALQNAILTSADFSIIATDEKGIIQLFNVGAERMLGYKAADVVNRISPSDIQDPLEVTARARALSLELDTTIAPGFEALAFKASRGIEDIYELTYICKDGSALPAIISNTALRDDYGDVIGYLLTGTDNSLLRQRVEPEDPFLAPTDTLLGAIAAGNRKFTDSQREWCVAEAMVLAGFEFTPLELIEQGDAAIARIIVEARKPHFLRVPATAQQPSVR